MIKIAVISRIAYNYFFPGRIKLASGQGAYQMTKALAKYKHYNVFCLVGDFGQPAVLEKDNVTIIKAPIDNPLKICQLIKLYREIDADVYIEYCASPRLGLLVFMQKLLGKKYLYFTASDIDVDRTYRQVENNLYYAAYVWGLKHADAVIAQVPKHEELLKKNYDIDAHLILSPYFEVVASQPLEKTFVLWVGRAAYYKRPDLFIRIVQDNPDQQFVMICNESPYDRGFSRKIEKLKQLENLAFYDYVASPDIRHFFQKAKLLVNTSEFEGFSNTFIEAAKEYTPILSLNSDPNGMLSTYHAGVVCGGEENRLFKEIKRLVQDNAVLQRLGQHAFDYARRFHQIDHAAARVNKIIQEII